MKHPLINKQAKHYSGEREAIFQIEDEMSINGLIGACHYNMMKYDIRKNSKGQLESDMIKIDDYKRYLEFLESFNVHYRDIVPASNVYRLLQIKFDEDINV